MFADGDDDGDDDAPPRPDVDTPCKPPSLWATRAAVRYVELSLLGSVSGAMRTDARRTIPVAQFGMGAQQHRQHLCVHPYVYSHTNALT